MTIAPSVTVRRGLRASAGAVEVLRLRRDRAGPGVRGDPLDRLAREGQLDAQSPGLREDFTAEFVAAGQLVGKGRHPEVDLHEQLHAASAQAADVDFDLVREE